LQPAYDLALRRADLAETRARANLTFAGTFMFAAPAFVTAALGPGTRSFASPFFVLGAAAFAGVVLCLLFQQLPQVVGDLQVVSLEVITDDQYLEVDPDTFKLNLLLYGVGAWQANTRYLARMGRLATAGALLFGVQVAVLAVWVLRG
jgi:hypothetical protein